MSKEVLEINDQCYDYLREENEIDPIDLLDWLQKQTEYPKIFWQERDGKTATAAFGSLLQFSDVPTFSSADTKARFFGGRAFPKKRSDSLWDSFPMSTFFLPSCEMVKQGKDYTLIRNCIGDQVPDSVSLDAPPLSIKKNELLFRSDTPDVATWKQCVDKCLENIQKKHLEKIVLARRTSLTFKEPLNAFAILKGLQDLNQRATLFAYQPTKDSVFIGATPELLYHRENKNILSEAIAGTRPRGRNFDEDHDLQIELLSSIKENREFFCVKHFMKSILSPLCTSLEVEKNESIIATHTVQHLYNRFRGDLKSEVKDAHLLDMLHPTPATGGFPQKSAIECLSLLEPFDRGWYASAIGWIGKDSADIAVGIRSALVEKNQLHLFAGTGIVEGSNAQREWEELDQKIAQFQKVLL